MPSQKGIRVRNNQMAGGANNINGSFSFPVVTTHMSVCHGILSPAGPCYRVIALLFHGSTL